MSEGVVTWFERDEPVLRAIVELSDEGADSIYPKQITERTGLSSATVQVALKALVDNDPPLISAIDSGDMGGGRQIGRVTSPTGRARRMVGTWPSGEGLAEQIIRQMEAAAEAEENEESRGRIRQTVAWMRGAGRDVFVEVTAAVISKQMGL